LIVPLTHQLLEELTRTKIDPELALRGFAYLKNGKIETALPVLPLELKGWGSDGLVGFSKEPGIVNQLVGKTLEDLKKIDSRVFIVFDKLPGLKPAGELQLLEARGHDKEATIELAALEDNEEAATLLRACQVGSHDFEEIPNCEDSLDPYRGYGTSLWRQWQGKGVLLINPIDDLTNHLAFVGLLPEERHHGIGTSLISQALTLTGPHKKITTAVDARNHAACRAYRKLGFEVTELRSVFFKSFV
jgi:GNAT superfamily N-acetyltransferase